MKKALLVAVGVVAGSAVTAVICLSFFVPRSKPPAHRVSFLANIEKVTADNKDFRRVLFTGARSQVVVMSIPPGGEVGTETHVYVEQTLYFRSGTGQAVLDGKTSDIRPGDVVVVTPGTVHNFINTGRVPLQILTTYSPPNHFDGLVEHTKGDADANVADEAFGEAVR